jgi:hypothetical protein
MQGRGVDALHKTGDDDPGMCKAEVSQPNSFPRTDVRAAGEDPRSRITTTNRQSA